MTDTITVLCLVPLSPAERERIESMDPRVRVIEAAGTFDGEMRETWARATTDRFLKPGSDGSSTRASRNRLLANAEIVVITFPFPLDLRARSPRLIWVHQQAAGASNQKASDLWNSDVVVTTTRGHAANLPIAEYVIACFSHFGRGLHRASDDLSAGKFDYSGYRPVQLAGKTACIVGAGGIGREVGRLAAALGMRVLGTRRSTDGDAPPGFEQIRSPDALHELLGMAEFVAVCCQWTRETEGLIGPPAFAAMRSGTVLVNVARGEIIDEEALIDALAQGKLRGVGLDVYDGEFEGLPDERLWADPRVLITPHISSYADVPTQAHKMDVFCHNLKAYLAGRTLENVIDWTRGY